VQKEATAIDETRNRENEFQRGDLRPVGNSKNRSPTLIPVIQLDDNDFVVSGYEGEFGLIIPRGTHDHLLIIRKVNTFFGKAKKTSVHFSILIRIVHDGDCIFSRRHGIKYRRHD